MRIRIQAAIFSKAAVWFSIVAALGVGGQHAHKRRDANPPGDKDKPSGIWIAIARKPAMWTRADLHYIWSGHEIEKRLKSLTLNRRINR